MKKIFFCLYVFCLCVSVQFLSAQNADSFVEDITLAYYVTVLDSSYIPNDTTPYMPIDTTPVLPIDTTPYMPVDTTPYVPVDTTPYVPVDTTPVLPIDTTPYVPVDTTPVLPIDTTPYVPVDTTPVLPIDTTPYVPVDTTPVLPIDTTPYVPVDTTPVLPIDTTPYVPVDTTPVLPIDTTPTPIYCDVFLYANDSNLGNVRGAGSFEVGSHIRIAAYPLNGNYFQCWSDGNTDSVRVIEVTHSIRLTALFAPVVLDTTPNYEVTATDTTAVISVPLYQHDSVSYYLMTISTEDGDTILLYLNAAGQVINDSSRYNYSRNSRHVGGKHRLLGEQAPVNISISGLLAGKRYTYTIDAIDNSGNIINRQGGQFATTGEGGTTGVVENTANAKLRSTKQIINGQLYIITADGQRYTANGVRK